MNAESSRSANCACSLQIELENDSFVSIGSSSISAMPGNRNGAFIPPGAPWFEVHRVSNDSDGAHTCDHTRGADRKQSDDGIDDTFVSARERASPFNVCYVVVDPALENRYQSTMDMHMRGGSCFSGK
jgi:hypothetical protein